MVTVLELWELGSQDEWLVEEAEIVGVEKWEILVSVWEHILKLNNYICCKLVVIFNLNGHASVLNYELVGACSLWVGLSSADTK